MGRILLSSKVEMRGAVITIHRPPNGLVSRKAFVPCLGRISGAPKYRRARITSGFAQINVARISEFAPPSFSLRKQQGGLHSPTNMPRTAAKPAAKPAAKKTAPKKAAPKKTIKKAAKAKSAKPGSLERHARSCALLPGANITARRVINAPRRLGTDAADRVFLQPRRAPRRRRLRARPRSKVAGAPTTSTPL